MENQEKDNAPKRGLAHWENEVEYFNQAMYALQMCHGLLGSLRQTAQDKVEELTPQREEVEE